MEKVLKIIRDILLAIVKILKNEKPIEQPIETPIEEKPIEIVEVKKTSIKEYQTMLKRIGFYTKSIDGKVGDGTKKAIKQFNITFLNKDTEVYNDDTDKTLKIIYTAYEKSKYMTDELWVYFKNFKKAEYKCPKHCDGYPTKIAIRLVIADQFLRNSFDKSVRISSGLRCKKHNAELKGSSKNSFHLKGQASDCSISGISSQKLMAKVVELPFVSYSYLIDKNYIHKSVLL